jgi:hypothetical protein
VSKYAYPSFPAIFADGQPGIRQFDRDLLTTLSAWASNLAAILDAGISVDDNMDATRISVTSHATPGTQFSVAHGLGKTPLGYIVCGQNKAGTLYYGATATDKTTLYLKSDASSATFNLLVF